MSEKYFFIVSEKCVGCLACAEDCPERAVNKSEIPPKIDQSLCIRCGDCHEICPVGAIVMKEKISNAK